MDPICMIVAVAAFLAAIGAFSFGYYCGKDFSCKMIAEKLYVHPLRALTDYDRFIEVMQAVTGRLPEELKSQFPRR